MALVIVNSRSDESWTHITMLSTVGFNMEPTISWQTRYIKTFN